MENMDTPKSYPAIEPFATHMLAVGDGHTLYLEESGHLQGIPVIFLHGGPGSYCKPQHRCFFNPRHYRIILFDQRGAGRSTPAGNIQHNTTQHLLTDMETIRQYLGIDNWLVFGGSWGATLGLLYALTYPERVLGLILRGTFLARQHDLTWFYHHNGVARLFPQYWEAFTNFKFLTEKCAYPPVKKGEVADLLSTYNYLLRDDTPQAHQAALAWSNWEGTVISMAQFPRLTEPTLELLHAARVACHYISNNCFIEDNIILQQATARLAHIPTQLIHGQQDLICPLESAYQLHQALPHSQLMVLPNSGHLSSDPAMFNALVQATDSFLQQQG
ncbi:proline iminopeptidase [Beggiatoa alba B18LD]|uniref:Proline iminopeptidase n=1 Tax=Beggiatoa alba B18LD TaxID=395493 RepID=I3CKL4_9GAMM|nr:prolyl aminopeptidase [Beggiatoa alba]EIJ44157.1 proline iminopeptidase [Beggiatoa alba B18LD]